MIRQYNPQRCQGGPPITTKRGGIHRQGTIPVGTILYIQDRLGRYDKPVFRNPWIVQAWIPRDYCGYGPTKRMVGGHLAVVKSLRDGRVKEVSDVHLLAANEL